MTYDVLVDELRSASGSYATVAGSVGTAVELTHLTPDSIGHIELAAWVEAVADQCEKATTALKEGVTTISESLDAAAQHYETTDDTQAQVFGQPFGTSPFGTSPFGTFPFDTSTNGSTNGPTNGPTP